MGKYPDSGRLYKNDKKRPDQKDPEYTGQAEVNGVEYWMSAWVNDGQPGKGKFMSIKFKPKDDKAKTPAEAPKQQDNNDGALPF